MQFQKNDIFKKKERDGRIAVFIIEAWLVDNIKGLTALNLRRKYRPRFVESLTTKRQQQQAIKPDTGATFRFAKKNGTFYYDYDRLPENRKKHLPEKEELLRLYKASLQSKVQQQLQGGLEGFVQDLSPYLPAYHDCTDIQAKHLATAAAVIQYAANQIKSKEPTSSNAYYRHLSAVVKEKGWLYLPKNYRRLKDKIDLVVSGAQVTDVVKLPRQGNNNKKAFADAQVIGWIMYLRSRPENYSNAKIARRVLKMCKIWDKKRVPSFSWIEHYLSDNKTKWLTGLARHGSNRKAWDYQDYIPIAHAAYAGDCWHVDGTRINFIPHQCEDGKERSLYIIAIRDVYSGDIVGTHFCHNESTAGYIHAFNMAVQETGHLPYEVVLDRFPGSNSYEKENNKRAWKPIEAKLKREGVKVTVTHKATGKAGIERFFRTFQEVFLSDFNVYYGQGILSTRANARRCPKHMAKVKKQAKKAGWTFDDAWRAGMAAIRKYRFTPLGEYSKRHCFVEESPVELYQQSERPNVRVVKEHIRLELFGSETKGTLRNNGLLTIQIDLVKYYYKVTDYDLIANYKKVQVYYDIEDLSKVYLFDPSKGTNTKFLGEVAQFDPVRYYGPDKDGDALHKVKQQNKLIAAKQKEELELLIGGADADYQLAMGQFVPKIDANQAESDWLDGTMGALPAPDVDLELPTIEVEESEALPLRELDLDELPLVRDY